MGAGRPNRNAYHSGTGGGSYVGHRRQVPEGKGLRIHPRRGLRDNAVHDRVRGARVHPLSGGRQGHGFLRNRGAVGIGPPDNGLIRDGIRCRREGRGSGGQAPAPGRTGGGRFRRDGRGPQRLRAQEGPASYRRRGRQAQGGLRVRQAPVHARDRGAVHGRSALIHGRRRLRRLPPEGGGSRARPSHARGGGGHGRRRRRRGQHRLHGRGARQDPDVHRGRQAQGARRPALVLLPVQRGPPEALRPERLSVRGGDVLYRGMQVQLQFDTGSEASGPEEVQRQDRVVSQTRAQEDPAPPPLFREEALSHLQDPQGIRVRDTHGAARHPRPRGHSHVPAGYGPQGAGRVLSGEFVRHPRHRRVEVRGESDDPQDGGRPDRPGIRQGDMPSRRGLRARGGSGGDGVHRRR